MPAGAKKILVIDDHRDFGELVRALLEDKGYELAVAYSGQAGFDAAVQGRPDLIILDVMMPGMSGYEVAAQVRAHPRIRHTPFIICSAKRMVSDVDKGLAAGADDYLVKPFDPPELLGKLERLLGN